MHRTRRALAATLVVLGAILGPLAATGLWARAVIGDTDTYVDAVAPLATDPAITEALEARVTDAVMAAVDKLDVPGQLQGFLTDRGMPARLANLISAGVAGLDDSLRGVVSRTAAGVIEDPRFDTSWQALNRTAHRMLVGVLDGDSALLDADGNLALSLRPVLDAVRQRLVDNGQSWVSLLPDTLDASWVLVPADKVDALRDTINAVRTGTVELAILAVLAVVGAILAAPDRARGIVWMALGLIIGALAMLATLRYGERLVINAYPQLQHPAAIRAMIRSVTSALVTWLRWLFVVSVVAAILAALLGRGERAARTRAHLARLRDAMGRPPYSGPRRIVAAALAGGCAVTLVLVDDPAPAAIGALLLGVMIGAVLALIPGVDRGLTDSAGSGAPDPK